MYQNYDMYHQITHTWQKSQISTLTLTQPEHHVWKWNNEWHQSNIQPTYCIDTSNICSFWDIAEISISHYPWPEQIQKDPKDHN